MMSTVDYEHQALARLIDNVAATVHGPDDCPLCAGLDLRRHLHGLADQIRAEVNNTPHEHGPKPAQPDPKPADPPPASDPAPSPPPQDRSGS